MHKPMTDDEFFAQCVGVLNMLKENAAYELHKDAGAGVPLPQRFLLGTDSIDSDLWPLVGELGVALARRGEHGEVRNLSIDDALTRIMRLGLYRKVLLAQQPGQHGHSTPLRQAQEPAPTLSPRNRQTDAVAETAEEIADRILNQNDSDSDAHGTAALVALATGGHPTSR